MCGCLLLTVAPGIGHGNVPRWCSPRRQREAAGSQGQPPSKNAADQAWRDPAIATRPWHWYHGRNPLSSSSSSSSIPPTPFCPSPPLHPRKRCFCQNPAALSSGTGVSLSLALTSTYGLAYSLLCELTHTEVAPTYSSTCSSSLVPSIPSPSFLSFPLPPWPPTPPVHCQAELPPILPVSLLFLTAPYKHRALA